MIATFDMQFFAVRHHCTDAVIATCRTIDNRRQNFRRRYWRNGTRVVSMAEMGFAFWLVLRWRMLLADVRRTPRQPNRRISAALMMASHQQPSRHRHYSPGLFSPALPERYFVPRARLPSWKSQSSGFALAIRHGTWLKWRLRSHLRVTINRCFE